MTLEQELIKAQSELNTVSQDLAIAQDKIKKMSAELKDSRESIATAATNAEALQATLKTEREAHAASEKAHAEALAAKEADLDKRVNLKVHERCAQLGIKPVKDEPATGLNGNDNVMSRDEFNKLPAASQMKFVKSGGKLKD